MSRFYAKLLLLVLYLTSIISYDGNESVSETTFNQDLNVNSEGINSKSHHQLLNEHLKVIIIFGGVSIIIMIVIVNVVIIKKYLANKRKNRSKRTEQTRPLTR